MQCFVRRSRFDGTNAHAGRAIQRHSSKGREEEQGTHLPRILRDRRCRLVSFGIEVGGRWSDEAATFLRLLAHTKARQAPALLRHSRTNALTTAGAPCLCMWPRMLLQHPSRSLTKDLSGCHNLEGNTSSISEIPRRFVNICKSLSTAPNSCKIKGVRRPRQSEPSKLESVLVSWPVPDLKKLPEQKKMRNISGVGPGLAVSTRRTSAM